MKRTKANRRSFVKRASAVAIGGALAPVPVLANRRLEKPTLIGIGAGGKGRTDLEKCKQAGFDVIALCDVVDATKLTEIRDKRTRSIADVRKAYPDALFGTDYRELLTQLGDKVDAVLVSTPDHHHFHASMQAMRAGKHVYCQKPLTHGIWEARMLAQTAAETGVKTQMGNQAHAADHMRRCVELIRGGIVGRVQEIHAWTNRPIWPQGFKQPPERAAIPAGIDWKQWCGPAPWVDYSPVIAPFAWRGWWNYGTGALGDMACHIMDVGLWAMDAGAPRSVVAEQRGATEYSPPINSQIVWEFDANKYSAREGFKFHWYDGYVDATFNRTKWILEKNGDAYNHPDATVLDGEDFSQYGSVIIGDQGKLFFNRSKGWSLKVDNRVDRFEWPEEQLPRAAQEDNYLEWYQAVTGEIATGQSHFGHAGPMTETILLGVLAQRFPGQKLDWNAEALAVEGRPELAAHIRRSYADGWSEKELL